MRLWSLHPRYLDRAGLVAVWREALLAQQVLAGRTRGYRNHPQLARFRSHPHPDAAIGAYLEAVADEALQRNYRFNRAKIEVEATNIPAIEVTDGQMLFERAHLATKLARRAPAAHEQLEQSALLQPHPCFRVIPGPVANWERQGSENP
ncbi:MAG: pyrimidine dimer DNA glycosylase/endonuclease V [Chloroflexi bacterium]|nr:pyrimidine dimer DNA glycosylase/endonuclease V [Chloroflexota bacterium]